MGDSSGRMTAASGRVSRRPAGASETGVDPRVRRFIESHRVARLATADAEGAPHVVPICYVYDGERIYSALDLKPKRVSDRQLKRVRNILANPRVSLVIDDYSEDWDRLAYVLVRGRARVVEDVEESREAEDLLRAKYPQYSRLLEQDCTILCLTPDRVVSWGAV